MTKTFFLEVVNTSSNPQTLLPVLLAHCKAPGEVKHEELKCPALAFSSDSGTLTPMPWVLTGMKLSLGRLLFCFTTESVGVRVLFARISAMLFIFPLRRVVFVRGSLQTAVKLW